MYRFVCNIQVSARALGGIWWLRLLCLLYLAGCDATRYLPQGEKLVKNTPTFYGNTQHEDDELLDYVQTARDRRILIPKFYLHVYNAGTGLKVDSSWIKGMYYRFDKKGKLLNGTGDWMREVVGSPPTTVNRVQLVKDRKNLENFYFSQGYFHTQVRFRVKPLLLNPRKAIVSFHIEEGIPALYQEVTYNTKSAHFLALLAADSASALIKKGDPYREPALVQERERISTLMRNHGYYRFSASDITFEVDTTLQRVPLVQQVAQARSLHEAGLGYQLIRIKVLLPDTGQVYTVDSLYFSLSQGAADTTSFRLKADELSPRMRKALRLPSRRLSPSNPLVYYPSYQTHNVLNYNFLQRQVAFRPDSLYRLNDYKLTQRQLQRLGVFGQTFIRVEASNRPDKLNLWMETTLQPRFFHQERIELFQSQDRRINTNLPGLGGSLQLGNRNAFGRAEQLDVQLNGNLFLFSGRQRELRSYQLYYQYGLNINFSALQFYFLDSLVLRLSRNPRLKNRLNFHDRATGFSFNFNQELNQQFQRQNFLLSWQYSWSHYAFSFNRPSRWQSVFKPYVVTFVNSKLAPDFEAELTSDTDDAGNFISDNELRVRLFTLRDFESRLVTASTYIRTYSLHYLGKQRSPGWYLRMQADLGGNVPWLIDYARTQLGSESDDISARSIGVQGLVYSQFYRLGLDSRMSQQLSRSTQAVFRLQCGAGRSFNHTPTVPFEYRFFSGGVSLSWRPMPSTAGW